jgi:hypothetical protein
MIAVLRGLLLTVAIEILRSGGESSELSDVMRCCRSTDLQVYLSIATPNMA